MLVLLAYADEPRCSEDLLQYRTSFLAIDSDCNINVMSSERAMELALDSLLTAYRIK